MRLSQFSRTASRRVLDSTLLLALLASSATPSLGQERKGTKTTAQLRGNASEANPPSGSAPTKDSKVVATPASNARSIKDSEAGPPIVAVVNNQSITLQDLAQQCVLRYGDQILDNIVNRYLILQACQSKKIEISQKDVDDEIARVASKFNLSVPMYTKLLQEERNITPEQYASDIVWPMLALRQLGKDLIQVSPQEIDRAFQSEFGPKVQVRMIVCKDLEQLKGIHAQAMANPDSFKTLARTHSEDANSASVDGLIPPIRRFSGDDEFEAIAFGLQPGEISKIFTVSDIHVTLQCLRHVPPANPPAPQLAEIQNRIKSEMQEQKLRESAEKMYTDLRQNAQVVTVLGHPELQQQYPGVAAILNGQGIMMDILEKECIKRFGPQTLEGEINRKLVEEALAKAGQQVTQAEIDQEIRNTAEFYGYINADGTPDLQRWIADVLSEDGKTVDLYVRDAVWPTVALKKLVANRVAVTEEDLKKGFEASFGQRAEVLAIVLSNQRTAQEVWEMARNRSTEQFFGELANQYSVEPSSRANFGKVPPLRKHGGQPNLEKAAFGLKPGEMSGIVEVAGQYVIVRCQGFTDPVVKEFQAVKTELSREILEKKTRVEMDSFMSKLISDSQVTNLLNPKKSRVGAVEAQASRDELKKLESAKR
jgi:parvulin-like peptidyl-prolyl isomerase